MVPVKDRVRSIQEVLLRTNYIHGDHVSTTEGKTSEEEMSDLVYHCEVALTNYEAIEFPEIIHMSK